MYISAIDDVIFNRREGKMTETLLIYKLSLVSSILFLSKKSKLPLHLEATEKIRSKGCTVRKHTGTSYVNQSV